MIGRSLWVTYEKFMNTKSIESQFRAMGARLKVLEMNPGWNRQHRVYRSDDDYAVDIRKDKRGQYFEIRVPEAKRDALSMLVMQNEPRQRHLLLLVRSSGEEEKLDRFLCGHDEREWFVAAVPGGASSVRQAMDALRPKEAEEALAKHGVRRQKRYSRKNDAFRRQGEWFFIPQPDLELEGELILKNEAIRRGGGKPHVVQELVRRGGESVWVSWRHRNGLTEDEYRETMRNDPEAAKLYWSLMRRNPEVYARGEIRHRDHQTINLPYWHRVVMNTENQTATMKNMAFLD